MFGDVEVQVHHPPALTVPVDAISNHGARKVVFIEREQGTFEPREIKTGPTLGGRVVVEQGLHEGDRIVVAGNFLIDSESRLRHSESAGNQSGLKKPE
jgi:Cu(I)/Ag(I) efflux system membrane fusion protein